MRYKFLVLLAAVLLYSAQTHAQQLYTHTLWEHLHARPNSPDAPTEENLYARLYPFPSSYAVGGCSFAAGWKGLFAGLDSAGTLRWQFIGGLMGACEQDMIKQATGYAIAGYKLGPAPYRESLPFLQWLRLDGTVRRTQWLDTQQVKTIPQALFAEPDGYVIGGSSRRRSQRTPFLCGYQYTLTCTDTTGQLIWTRTYTLPNGDCATALTVVRRPTGYLLAGLSGIALNSSQQQLRFVDVDWQGNLRRVRETQLFGGTAYLTMRKLSNSFTVLRDGGIAFAGIRDTAQVSPPFVASLDSAFTVRWTRHLPPQRGNLFGATHVREMPDGTLQILGFDDGGVTPYMYLLTLNPATGRIIRQQEFHLPQFRSLSVLDWQPLPDSSIVVAGSAQLASAPATAFRNAWIGRYKLLPRPLATATPGAATAPGTLLVYPNPASEGAQTTWAELPASSSPGGHLTLLDALGRPVREQAAVPDARRRVALPVAGLAPGLYVVRYTTAAGRRYQARLLKR